MKYLFIVV